MGKIYQCFILWVDFKGNKMGWALKRIYLNALKYGDLIKVDEFNAGFYHVSCVVSSGVNKGLVVSVGYLK